MIIENTLQETLSYGKPFTRSKNQFLFAEKTRKFQMNLKVSQKQNLTEKKNLKNTL